MAIVLGYDETPGANSALEVALEVAKAFDDELIVIYGAAPPGGLGEEFRSHLEILTSMGRSALDHATTRAAQSGVAVRVELVEDRPVTALLAAADEVDARMIIVGTWSESPIKGAILGSTPHRLLHLSERPVLCVPAGDEESTR